MRNRRLAAINTEFASRNTAITRIANDFKRSESYVRGLLTSVSQFRAHRRPSLRRALLHPEGETKLLKDLQGKLKEDIEDGTVVMDDIDDTERKRLIDQLIEHQTEGYPWHDQGRTIGRKIDRKQVGLRTGRAGKTEPGGNRSSKMSFTERGRGKGGEGLNSLRMADV
ncbi:hypothetical protein R3P38DRAFT_2808669 [Favolaschia claudopus]|uniref:Uncharacterized protein n=1 Tax=Favolaschia claudopus TaxID=2862362 RepID=A0AAV9ZFI8_9AGAR